MAAYGVLHSVLASTTAKIIAKQYLGKAAVRLYRLVYNIIGLLSLIPVLIIPVLLPGRILYRLSGPWMILALSGQVLAVMLIVVGLLHTDPWHFLGIRQLVDPESNGNEELVVSGLYRWVRHPLYTTGLLFIWLIPVMTTSLLVLVVSLSAYIYVGSIFEERRLLEEYGSAYETYRQRVPRLIPRFWPSRKSSPDRSNST